MVRDFETTKLMVMNSQHASNPLEQIEITKCSQIYITTLKSLAAMVKLILP
jgi:heme oxygenase